MQEQTHDGAVPGILKQKKINFTHSMTGVNGIRWIKLHTALIAILNLNGITTYTGGQE